MSGIYFHIPFCKKACIYCDFHFSTKLSNSDLVVQAMLNEVELKQNFLPQKHLHSIYFGGGTPSLLTKKQLALLLNAVHKYFSLSENAEITFEVNPENITNENLKLWQHENNFPEYGLAFTLIDYKPSPRNLATLLFTF